MADKPPIPAPNISGGIVGSLDPFFRPRSIAIVGAGDRPTSSGAAVLQMLQQGGYPGRLIPINPKGGTAFGLDISTSLSALSEPAELCIVVIRPDGILDIVREAAASGHRHLLILPGGFAEAGVEGLKRDAELRQLIAEHGLTVAGPNCAGLIRHDVQGSVAATFLRSIPPGGGVALLSQSGAVAEEMVAAANALALPIGTVVSVGNAVQLGVTEYPDHLADDPACTAVLLYVESIDDVVAFRTAARRAAQRKPVVMLMGGRTAVGARAASAHTGAVPNSDAAITAFAEECCILRVHSLRDLMLAAKGFGFFPQGFGKRILILSNAGGPAVLAADRAVLGGLDVPPLPPKLDAALHALLPAEASAANPVDILADAREDRFGAVLDAMAESRDAYDAVLGVHVVPFMVDPVPVVARIAAGAKHLGLPMMHTLMGTLPERPAMQAVLERAGIPHFADVEEMAGAAVLLARYPGIRAQAHEPAPTTKPALRARRD